MHAIARSSATRGECLETAGDSKGVPSLQAESQDLATTNTARQANAAARCAGTRGRMRSALIARRGVGGVQVRVDLQLNALLGLDEAGQTFTADFTLTTSWTDPRLRNPDAPALADYPAAMLEAGQIWSPRLVLANRRGEARGSESRLQVRPRARAAAERRWVVVCGGVWLRAWVRAYVG